MREIVVQSHGLEMRPGFSGTSYSCHKYLPSERVLEKPGLIHFETM